MKNNITVVASILFMLSVSIFSVFIINMSDTTDSAQTVTVTSGGNITDTADESPRSNTATVSLPASTAAVQSKESGLTSFLNTEPPVISAAPSFPMDINDADMSALLAVPGIGEVTAGSILSYKNSKGKITSMDMLLEINGIGEKTLSHLKEYFYVSDIYTVTADITKIPASTKTTSSKTSTAKKTSATTTPTPERAVVNINTADQNELMRCLLITEQQANDIISIRTQIGGYTTTLEVLYCDSISDRLYTELEPYMMI